MKKRLLEEIRSEVGNSRSPATPEPAPPSIAAPPTAAPELTSCKGVKRVPNPPAASRGQAHLDEKNAKCQNLLPETAESLVARFDDEDEGEEEQSLPPEGRSKFEVH